MSDATGNALILALMLILPLSGLVARRLPIGRVALMGLAWVGLFGVGLVLVALFSEDAPLGRGVHRLLHGTEQEVAGGEVRVPMAEDGHFYVTARINGVERRMLVDSGATMTALSVATAHEAGLDATRETFPIELDTANGNVTADRMTVARLSIDSLTTRDLGAAVSPAFGDTDVLGMNFLSRLGGWRVEGRTLILKASANFT